MFAAQLVPELRFFDAVLLAYTAVLARQVNNVKSYKLSLALCIAYK